MQPLVAYREDLIARTHKVIPHFDPEDGGVKAELLLLLSHVDGDPGIGKNGSDFISMENEDDTATNFREVIRDLGLKRSSFVIWNVVPWQGGKAVKDAAAGAMHLPRLVKLLPALRGVAVLSMKDQQRKAAQKELAQVTKLVWLLTSNPGPQSFNLRKDTLTQELRSFALRLNLIR